VGELGCRLLRQAAPADCFELPFTTTFELRTQLAATMEGLRRISAAKVTVERGGPMRLAVVGQHQRRNLAFKTAPRRARDKETMFKRCARHFASRPPIGRLLGTLGRVPDLRRTFYAGFFHRGL
jgi:3-methyladenine DNA glycosylase/8-oxoguanine DNA glycosylase